MITTRPRRSPRWWGRAGVATGAVVLVAGLSQVAGASPGATNGRLTFMRQDDQGYQQVWTSNPDLGAEHQITSGKANSGWAVWSPDASRIAFDSDRSELDPMDEVLVNDVFSMRADGTDVRQITDSQGFSGDPAYAPDGRLIAFDSDRVGHVGSSGQSAAAPHPSG